MQTVNLKTEHLQCSIFQEEEELREQIRGQRSQIKVTGGGAEMWKSFLAHIFTENALIYVKLELGWSTLLAAHFVRYNAAARMHNFPR